MAPYLCLLSENAPQRNYALRYLAYTGCPWRYLPGDLPHWATVYQQWTQGRYTRVFEAIVHDVNELQRVLLGRAATPSAVVLDRRTLQSTPESEHRAGGDGARRRKGSKVPLAVATLGQLLRMVITPPRPRSRSRRRSASCAARCRKLRAKP